MLLGLFIAGAIFCLIGVMQSVWLSATPNFSQEQAKTSVAMWSVGTMLFLVASVITALLIYRGKEGIE